jgi:ribosomal protein S18 acetylase RimI-like enzyme
MEIRKATIKDCKVVRELCKTPGLLTPFGNLPKLWWIEAFIKEKQMFFVAEEDKNIIGFVMGERLTGNIGYISMISVRKEFQGKGLGKILMKCIEEECKRRKFRAISLFGYRRNKRAINLFEGEHFKEGQAYEEFIKFLK